MSHPTGAYIPSCDHCAQEGHFLRECPKGGQPRSPPGPCSLCKGNHWRAKCPLLQMKGGVPPPMDWWVSGPPFQAPLLSINVEESQITIMVEKWKVIFLLDSGVSVLPFSPCPWSNDKVIIQGISGQPLKHYFTQPLACSWGDHHFYHSFLIVAETPVPLLGWDLLS
jgi:hypothetical protein